MTKNRIRLAFLLAPLGPALYLISVWLLSRGSGRHDVFMTLLFALPVSYLSCLAFGMPLLHVLRARDSLSAITVVTVGALLGVVVNYLFGYLLAALLGSNVSVVPVSHVIAWGLILGLLVAVPFVLIAGIPLLPRRNPSPP